MFWNFFCFFLGAIVGAFALMVYIGKTHNPKPGKPQPASPQALEPATSPTISRPAKGKPLDLVGSGEFSCEIVGESNYQSALNNICGGKTEQGHEIDVPAQLQLDNTNAYDPLAVKVCIRGQKVGHLSRVAARHFRATHHAAIDAGVDAFNCMARITGGWDRPDSEGSYGVRLDIA